MANTVTLTELRSVIKEMIAEVEGEQGGPPAQPSPSTFQRSKKKVLQDAMQVAMQLHSVSKALEKSQDPIVQKVSTDVALALNGLSRLQKLLNNLS